MDLTVAAVPFYFGTMEIERRWLKRRPDDPKFAAGQYDRPDTKANLIMGTASLVAPLVTMTLRKHLELGRGRWAKPLLAVGATGAAATIVADRVRRRRPDHKLARKAAEIGSVTAVVAIGLVTTSTWGAKLSAKRLWDHRRADLGSGWKPLAAAIAGWDFIYYWNHRSWHESRFLWAIHVVHHSSERYNLSVALRQPVADALGTFVPYGLLCLVGISPTLVESARGINLVYQYWIHTEAVPKLGPLEGPLNTASHHRVHHGTNSQYIDRNHGSILILWDRLFGTFEAEGEQVTYGLTTNLDTFSPVTIAGHEHLEMLRDVARSTSWRERLSFIFRGPGWAYEQHRLRGERPPEMVDPV
jgi:sterol desaturase/sphingolipid hydroxylase (fatty acid hydroxylase superfamily)